MTIDEIKSRKKELGYSNEMLSRLSGVPLGTIQKIMCGATRSPRYATLRALESALNRGADNAGSSAQPEVPDCRIDDIPCRADTFMLKESPSQYSAGTSPSPLPVKKKQGEYTIEDYYALPDERRVELINGVFYDMASPASIHQAISSFLSYTFFDFIKSNQGSCHVFTAPLDVQLNRDNKTIVQPDVMVICNPDKYKNRIIYGAPELVIEILSPSTRGKDLVLKLNKYCEAGVTEYWTVDPELKEVTVYTFAEEIESVKYDSESVVPVRIFEGKCTVDLKELFDYVSFISE